MTHVAVVGASGAIGQAFVRQFADMNGISTVWALSRKESISGNKIRHLKLDLTDDGSIESAAGNITSQLDTVIVASGLLHSTETPPVYPEKRLSQLDGNALQRLFLVNSIGPALVMKHFLPLLRREDRSVFAVLSARVGSITDNHLGGWYGYRASKAALNMLVRTAAIEMRRSNPRAIVVGLHPGTVDSKLSGPFRKNVPPEKLFSPAQAVNRLCSVLSNLDHTHSGKCLAHDGSEIPA